MSITLINYLTMPLGLGLSLYILLKNLRSLNNILIAVFGILMSFGCVILGLGFDLGNAGQLDLSLTIIRFAQAFIIGIYLIFFRLSLTFPTGKKALWIANLLITLFYLPIAYVCNFTALIVERIELRDGIFFRVEGPLYKVTTAIMFAIAISGMIILLIRNARGNRIHFQQSIIVAIGTLGSLILGSLITIIIPSVFHIFWMYPLGVTTIYIFLGSMVYALATHRLFDVSASFRNFLLGAIYIIVLGSLSGFGFFGLLALRAFIPDWILILPAALYFAGLVHFRRWIHPRTLAILRRKSDYAENLEHAIRDLNYASGTEALIDSITTSIETHMGVSDLAVIVENPVGELVPVWSSVLGLKAIDRELPVLKTIINADKTVVLKSEIGTYPGFRNQQDELTNLFNQYKAEALLFFFESNKIIGMFGFGKKTGGEYNSYDYSALKRIHSRLFVLMYFLRNSERQSVALTVEKELELSDQIISSLLENIDTISHEQYDFAFMSKTSSGLGGDFVDVIRLTKTKTLLIVGDVAGKGINASMSMIILKSVIRTFLRDIKDFKNLVIKVNSFIKSVLPRGTFFAGAFFLIDYTRHTIFWINCGIPLIGASTRTSNSAGEIQGTGKVLGFVKDISPFIELKKIVLSPGDGLIITTDGILEAESLTGERFGKQKIIEYFGQAGNQSSQEIVDNLYRKMLGFVSNNVNDDISIVVLQHNHDII